MTAAVVILVGVACLWAWGDAVAHGRLRRPWWLRRRIARSVPHGPGGVVATMTAAQAARVMRRGAIRRSN